MKLSVFVVTYNQEKYIRQCLDSILMQQVNFDYEVVIGEDHGSDHTRAICEEYAAKYQQIRLLPLTENLGIARNWQRVLSACLGEYIAMCEGDDYWTDPLKLQKQVDFLDSDVEKKYVMSFHDATIIDENGIVITDSKQGECKHDIASIDLMKGNHPSTQTVMFRQCVLNSILDAMKKGYCYNNGDTVLFTMLGQYGDAKYQYGIQNSVWRNHSNAAWSAVNEIDKDISSYHTYTFLQHQYNNDIRLNFLEARLNKLARIVQMALPQGEYTIFLLYYPQFVWLYIYYGKFTALYLVHKCIIYNIIKK